SDGMHRIVVAGSAEERQPAGEGQAPGITLRQADALDDVQHSDRKTAVEVEEVDVLKPETRDLQCVAHRSNCRRRPAQYRTLQQAALDEIGLPVQEYPPIPRYPQTSGGAYRRK